MLRVQKVILDAISEDACKPAEDQVQDLLNIEQCLRFLQNALPAYSSASKRWSAILVCCIAKFMEDVSTLGSQPTQPKPSQPIPVQGACVTAKQTFDEFLQHTSQHAQQVHMDYLQAYADAGRGSPQAAALMEFELQQIRHLVRCYDCKSPPQDIRLAELYFWNLLTAAGCFSWQSSAGGSLFSIVNDEKCVGHVDTFISFNMLEVLMATTDGRFASVFMSVFTGCQVFSVESGCLQLPSKLHELGWVWQSWIVSFAHRDLLTPPEVESGLTYFKDQLASFCGGLQGLGPQHSRQQTQLLWMANSGLLNSTVDSCMAFTDAAIKRRPTLRAVRAAVTQLQVLDSLLGAFAPWKVMDAEMLLNLKGSISSFLEAKQVYQLPTEHNSSQSARGGRSATPAHSSGMPIVDPGTATPAAATAVACDARSIARRYPPAGERQHRGAKSEAFGGRKVNSS